MTTREQSFHFKMKTKVQTHREVNYNRINGQTVESEAGV